MEKVRVMAIATAWNSWQKRYGPFCRRLKSEDFILSAIQWVGMWQLLWPKSIPT